MATLRTVDYVCDVCGTEIAVTGEGEGSLSPIYCCGVTVSEVAVRPVKKSGAAKSASRKKPKKTVSRSKPAKKSPVKKTSRKKK